MTQNLRLVGPKALTTANSQTAFSLTASNNGTWCTAQSAECFDKSLVLDSGRDDYGAYYNWYTATAGTGTFSKTSGNATGSICSKGWRLPTGGSSSEWSTLYNKYNSSALLRSLPFNLALSGYRYAGTSDQSDYGNYWSGTTETNKTAHSMSITSSIARPSGSSKYYGFAVRCIAQ